MKMVFNSEHSILQRIRFPHKIKIICRVFSLIFISFPLLLSAQPPEIVKKFKSYQKEVQLDSLKRMVELKSFVPNLRYDLRYATTNNFTGKKLYPEGKFTFLRLPVARALQKVETALNEKGLALKIFDAYRPYSVTEKMWSLIHDERYV